MGGGADGFTSGGSNQRSGRKGASLPKSVFTRVGGRSNGCGKGADPAILVHILISRAV